MIAREAGVADGTIYLYFKNKEDLFIQFFNYKIRHFFSRLDEAVDKGANAKEKLRFFIQRHLEEFQNDRDMAILYQAETHNTKRIAEESIKEMSRLYLNLISEIVEQGQEEGWVRKNLYLGIVKRMMIGAVDEVINTWIHKKGIMIWLPWPILLWIFSLTESGVKIPIHDLFTVHILIKKKE